LTSVIILLIISACNGKAQENESKSTQAIHENKEEKNKQVALECVRAWSSGNMDLILSHTAKDAVDYGDGSTPPARGIDTMKMFMNQWRFAVNEYKSSNQLAVSDSDYVFVYADWNGSFKTDFMGMKRKGKSFTLRILTFLNSMTKEK
jgi:SnoaL-like polyketide cyclase